jgi:cyclic-di-AMP phosphodiesterase PgpH
MPKETNKSGQKTGRAPLTRRDLFRRERRGLAQLTDFIFRSPSSAWNVLIWTAFVLVCSVFAIWARQQPLVAVGRVMNFTALVRHPFEMEDLAKTDQQRALARQRTPRVYDIVPATVEAFRTSIANLPKTLENVNDLQDDLAGEVERQFPRLTPESLEAIKSQLLPNGEVNSAWRNRTDTLIDILMQYPLLDDQTHQLERLEGGSPDVELHHTSRPPVYIPREQLVSIRDRRRLEQVASSAARDAGFPEPVQQTIIGRIVDNPEPMFQFSAALTEERREARAAAEPPVLTILQRGQPIFRRGDVLTPQMFEQYQRELAVFQSESELQWRVWVRSASIAATVLAIAMAMAGYLILFYPKVRQNPARMAAIAGLMAAALAISTFGTATSPGLVMLTAISPTVFIAVILVIAYDQRVALAIGTLHGVLTCIALDQPLGVYALILTGVSFAVLQLAEIRDRRGIIRMGLYAGAALAIGTVLVALIDRPILLTSIQMTLLDAALAGAGGLAVGVLTLAILPAIERGFDITTGMTLIELRDPKQPLLRMMQQRAPGTYNHSLNVASIAESAADSIKADALMTYVGALYHDIGKINKPEYFVENQSGGPNKHDKLSPAMSLLVIVGHVKDGVAMAQEYGLPRSIQHFIEAHHGTTLVEFFYNRARRQAEQQSAETAADPDLPEEIEYRYPGPKPRTKEVAILMLADAVESATRTMTEPTPGRIDALVRAIANKRLMDGQFDECDLTLRDLQTITESISRTVASIYHGRVLYPSTAGFSEKRSGESQEKRA